MNNTQRGYLLLADISGYTSYVASTELTHSQEILSELLKLIVVQWKTRMTIHKKISKHSRRIVIFIL